MLNWTLLWGLAATLVVVGPGPAAAADGPPAAGQAQIIFSDDYSSGKNPPRLAKHPAVRVINLPAGKGGKALQIEVQGSALLLLGSLTVDAGSSYQVRIRLRGLIQQPVEVMLRKLGKPYTKLISSVVHVGEQWQEHVIAGRAAAALPTGIFLKLQTNLQLLVDYVEITRLPADYKPEPDPMPAPGNLLHNASFELGDEAWYLYGRSAPQGGLAHSGKRSLLFSAASPGRISSTWHPVAIGRRYRLSCWAHTDQPGARLRLAVTSGTLQSRMRVGHRMSDSFRLEKQGWQRISFEVEIPSSASERRFFAEISPHSLGEPALRVDDVMFCPVATPESFRPRRPIEILVRSTGPKGVHVHGKPVNLTVLAVRHGKGDLPSQTRVVFLDERDQEGRQIDITLDAVGQGSTVVQGLPCGYWRLETHSGLPAEQVDEAEAFISVVPPMPDVPATEWFLGGHINTRPKDLEAAWLCGVRSDRFHGTCRVANWDIVEPTAGEFTFRDENVDDRLALGFSILGNLDRAPKWLEPVSGRNGTPMALSGSEIALWGTYVQKTVSHWKDRIQFWEITNESHGYHGPDGKRDVVRNAAQYARIAAEAARQIRQADPSALIVGLGGVNFCYRDFWPEVMKTDVFQHFDAISVHSYGAGTDSCSRSIKTYVEEVEKIRKLLQEHGHKALPIWDTEGGFGVKSASRKYGVAQVFDPYSAAALYVKMILARKAARVEKFYLYSMGDPRYAGNRNLPFYFAVNSVVTPPAVAMAVASSLLQEAVFEELRETPSLVQVRFRLRGKKLRVIWSTAQSVEVPLEQREKALNLWGREIAGVDGRLQVSHEPVYVLERQ